MGRRAPPNPPGRTLPAISTSGRTAALMSSKSPSLGNPVVAFDHSCRSFRGLDKSRARFGGSISIRVAHAPGPLFARANGVST